RGVAAAADSPVGAVATDCTKIPFGDTSRGRHAGARHRLSGDLGPHEGRYKHYLPSTSIARPADADGAPSVTAAIRPPRTTTAPRPITVPLPSGMRALGIGRSGAYTVVADGGAAARRAFRMGFVVVMTFPPSEAASLLICCLDRPIRGGAGGFGGKARARGLTVQESTWEVERASDAAAPSV